MLLHDNLHFLTLTSPNSFPKCVPFCAFVLQTTCSTPCPSFHWGRTFVTRIMSYSPSPFIGLVGCEHILSTRRSAFPRGTPDPPHWAAQNGLLLLQRVGGGGGEHAPSDRPSGLAAPQDRPGLARPGPEWRTTTLHGPCRPLSWGWERQEGTPEQGHQKKETGKSWIRSSSKGPFSPPSRWGGSLGRRTCWNVEPRPRGNPGSGCRPFWQ